MCFPVSESAPQVSESWFPNPRSAVSESACLVSEFALAVSESAFFSFRIRVFSFRIRAFSFRIRARPKPGLSRGIQGHGDCPARRAACGSSAAFGARAAEETRGLSHFSLDLLATFGPSEFWGTASASRQGSPALKPVLLLIVLYSSQIICNSIAGASSCSVPCKFHRHVCAQGGGWRR